MQRLAALLALAIFTVALASCGGGSNNNSSTPASLTLSPTSMTLSYGDVLTITPKFDSGDGTQVYPSGVTYSSSSSVASVSSNGQVCAGTWDSVSSPVVCTPGNTSGPATITVAGGGVSATTTVYVHPKVDRIVVSGSVDMANCLSLAATAPANQATLSARAYSGSSDVTQFVGPFQWTVGSGNVAAVDTSGLCTTDNTCVIKAAAPGQTSVYASLGSSPGTVISSGPGTFTSCPIKSISLHLPDKNDTSLSLDSAATQKLAVDVFDTKGNKLVDSSGALLAGVSLSYYSSQPLSATIISGSITAGSAGSSTTLGAACLPTNSCNANLSPVYSNPFSLKVNSSSTANTTTVYVASTKGTSLVPVDTSTNTAGTAITLPNTPNSIAMARSGALLYLGSSNGLMAVNTLGASISVNSTAVGKVISVSPNGNVVLVYDGPSVAPGNGTLHRYTEGTSTSAASVSSSPVPGAGTTAVASWSPDSSVAYVVTGTKLIVQPAIGIARTYDVGQPLNDVDFLAQGSFAYLTGTDVKVRATCSSAEVGSVNSSDIGGSPAMVRTLPNATAMLALYPSDLSAAVQRYLNPIAVSTTGAGCPPPVTNTPGTTIPLGTFIPGQIIVPPDSSKVFITATDSATVYAYDVASKAVTSIPLSGSGLTGTSVGGVTLDSKKLYIGAAGSNSLHVIDTSTNTDTQQISVGFQPDLVAVKPK